MAKARHFLVCLLAVTLLFLDGIGVVRVQAAELEEEMIRAPQTIEPCTGEGSKDGVHRQYFDDGKLFMETHCAGGKKHGVSVQYRPDGSVSREESYADGQLDGNIKEYHRNGLIISETYYKSGKLDGIQRRYWADGKMAFKREYRDGVASAPAEVYDSNGNVAQQQDDRFDGNSPAVEHLKMSGAADIRPTVQREATRNEEEASVKPYQPYFLEKTKESSPK